MPISSNYPPSAGASGRLILLPNDSQEASAKPGAASASVFKPSSGVAAPPRVCIVYGYPSATAGHGPRILQTVTKTLTESAAPFDVLDLYRSRFNPVTSDEEHLIYGKDVAKDVAAIQSILGRAEVWIFLYPVWWSTPPAILKGWIDRVLTPGFAFSNDSKGSHPLLGSKRALIIRTFGGSALVEQRSGNVASSFMEKAVLLTCGIKSVSQDIFSSETLAETAFANALFQAAGSVRRALGRPTGIPHHLRSIAAPYLPPIEPKLKLPVDEADEDKVELSDEAKSDLEYFKSARRQAREAVHRKADASMGGSRQHGQNQSSRQVRDRSGDRVQGRGRNEGRGRGRNEGGRSAFGSNQSSSASNFMRPSSNRSNEGRRDGRNRQKNWSGQNQGRGQGGPGQGHGGSGIGGSRMGGAGSGSPGGQSGGQNAGQNFSWGKHKKRRR